PTTPSRSLPGEALLRADPLFEPAHPGLQPAHGAADQLLVLANILGKQVQFVLQPDQVPVPLGHDVTRFLAGFLAVLATLVIRTRLPSRRAASWALRIPSGV